ncbi:unnamed protein product [Owenia fusiformis]|uniref:Methyltransferase FkbM domain-containing protein n=1 Tax=Owenia fusiformis TaxID=6347 RepID=A0A8S4PAG6_OWEFU|nr:unnamed protein product [Owenia fusiformis]
MLRQCPQFKRLLLWLTFCAIIVGLITLLILYRTPKLLEHKIRQTHVMDESKVALDVDSHQPTTRINSASFSKNPKSSQHHSQIKESEQNESKSKTIKSDITNSVNPVESQRPIATAVSIGSQRENLNPAEDDIHTKTHKVDETKESLNDTHASKTQKNLTSTQNDSKIYTKLNEGNEPPSSSKSIKNIDLNIKRIDTRVALKDFEFNCPRVVLYSIFRDKFPICVYTMGKDKYVSGAFLTGGYWEKQYVTAVMKELMNHPKWGFLDIGANIGTYTIPALKLGSKVIAIEAMQGNVDRISKAVQLNNLHENLTLLQNAVYDVHTELTFKPDKGNVGGTHVVGITKRNEHINETVKTIFLDETLQFIDFKEAIMKIDIEGSETNAFRKAKELLDKVKIVKIYMEFNIIRKSMDVVDFLEVMLHRGYSIYNARYPTEPLPFQKVQDYLLWSSNIIDIICKHKGFTD